MLSKKERQELLRQRAKEVFDNSNNETISIRDEITDIVETSKLNLGKNHLPRSAQFFPISFST